MATGLTGVPVHQGSWLGLPDFGITEYLQGQRAPQTATIGGGGSMSGDSGASGAWTVPNTTPTPKAVTADPSKSSFDNFKAAGGYAGWDPSAAWQDWNATGGSKAMSSGGGGSGDNLDAIYAPGYEALNRNRQAALEELPLLLQESQQGSDVIQRDLQAQLDQATRQLGLDTAKQSTEKESAFASARRIHNALTQQINSRFGRSSSTGGAASEILAGETARDMNSISQTYLSNLGQLQSGFATLGDFITRKKSEETERFTLEKEKIQKAVRDRVLQIENSRGQLDSDKAAAKLNAIENARNLMANIQTQWAENVAAIETLRAEETGNIQAGIEALNKQYQGIITSISQQTPYTPSLSGYTTPTQTTYPYKPGTNDSDPYKNVISPF